ncbi:MAG: NAD(+)/NADH kinase [Acidobacteria bacterium]|nr:NAD(+)/NADH kinase [Acidobacteriota bacterium]
MTIQRVGIVAKQGLVAASEHLTRLGTMLRERGVDSVYERDTAALAGDVARNARAMSRDALPHEVDLVIVLGGDGTLLSMAARIAHSGRHVPILGVNFGSLGFLTEIRIDELRSSLEGVLAGTASIDTRAMLAADASRQGQQVDSRVVLNDVVFTKTALSRVIDLSVSVNGGFVTRVKADGLIIATATGSTAYNLAAGGPIVHPMVDALVLTPIAPHTLTNRPVVIPGSAVVEVRTHTGSGPEEVYVTYDGQSGYPLHDGDTVQVRKSDQVLRLVKAPARGYFELLREKLKWGER